MVIDALELLSMMKTSQRIFTVVRCVIMFRRLIIVHKIRGEFNIFADQAQIMIFLEPYLFLKTFIKKSFLGLKYKIHERFSIVRAGHAGCNI